jgi:hypothetical protein
VADGYLRDRDQERYASWKNKAEVNGHPSYGVDGPGRG